MDEPDDQQDRRAAYWTRGPSTRLHRYFYPADDRAGLALMLLIGILGLIALGFGIRNMVRPGEIQGRDVMLTGTGLLAAGIGWYQAYRLRAGS